MSDQSLFDLSSATATLVVAVILIAVAIRLIPARTHMVWQVLPGVLVLSLIVAVLHSMVKKLLG